MTENHCLLCVVMIRSLLSTQTPDSDVPLEDTNRWKTIGFRQANSMDGGERSADRWNFARVYSKLFVSFTTRHMMAEEIGDEV